MSAVEQDEMTKRKTRTVTSAAGESVTIYRDEDWAEMTGASLTSVRKPHRTKLGLVRALWHQGTVTNSSGRATLTLHPVAQQYGYNGSPIAITSAMSDTLNAPAFDRQTNGKRTFSLSLAALPETWLMRMHELDALDPDPEPDEPEPEPEPIPEPSQGDRDAAVLMESVLLPESMREPELVVELPQYTPPPELEQPSPYLEVAPQVAMALLTQVVEIISAGSPEQTDARVRKLTQEVAEIADKLARRLQENDSMRRQLRTLGEELNAVKYERDGLRSRLRQTEHNLKVALKSDVMQQVNERVHRELEKVMRVVPSASPRHGDPD